MNGKQIYGKTMYTSLDAGGRNLLFSQKRKLYCQKMEARNLQGQEVRRNKAINSKR